MSLSRRRFIAAAALGAAAAGSSLPAASAASVVPGSADYQTLALRGYNRRFVAQPQRFEVPSRAEEVRSAVGAAVDEGLQVAARSGGHCFDGFVDSPQNQVIVDLNRMRGVDWDSEHGAVSVGAGTTLEELYPELERWGVTVPGGICKAVGVGGHITGGGYGPLSRQHGLIVDHLYGVEVVTVDSEGKARLTSATADGPNEDLWWAHTGGGGGNFGMVTRFLLRSPDAAGSEPETALPQSPSSVLTTKVSLPLATEDSFVRFMRNYLEFYARHNSPGGPFAGLYAPLSLRPTPFGLGEMLVLYNVDGPGSRARLDEFVDAVTAGVTPAPEVGPITEQSYADTVANTYYDGTDMPPRVKIKAAYMRQPYSDEQLRICYRHIVSPAFIGESDLQFLPFGGAVNAVAPDATAVPARDSFMKMLIHGAWRLPFDDERNVHVVRQFFGELYADTGGAPVLDERNGGGYINYPDPDMADPAYNTSGVPWSTLFYGNNYPRLRRVKADWDPNNIFRHRMSIEPA